MSANLYVSFPLLECCESTIVGFSPARILPMANSAEWDATKQQLNESVGEQILLGNSAKNAGILTLLDEGRDASFTMNSTKLGGGHLAISKSEGDSVTALTSAPKVTAIGLKAELGEKDHAEL